MQEIQTYRMLIFFTLLAIFLSLEYFRPSFPKQPYKKHIKVNIFLFVSSIVVMMIAFRYGLVKLAEQINLHDNSLLAIHHLPTFASWLITIVVFDVAIYWQHRLFHIVPFLWRSHKVHHSDQQMDVSTAVRFHPVEILLSGVYKIIIMLIIGPPAEAYLLYEVLLNGFALFTHGNFNIPRRLDLIIRKIFVTPAMHYPHHSPDKRLTNMNYGNIFSFWDRIFKSYTKEENAKFGLNNVNDVQAESIPEQLKMAFHK